jgi:hypothetical protein
MAAGSTYEPIATTTLGTATSSVEFTSITGTYTDLVYVADFRNSTNTNLYFRLNGVSTATYSTTDLYGNGSSAGSLRYSNTNQWVVDAGASGVGTAQSNLIASLQNYSNTTTYKTGLFRVNGGSYVTGAVVGLFPSTSAITSIRFFADQNFTVGSTFTLYGILAA